MRCWLLNVRMIKIYGETALYVTAICGQLWRIKEAATTGARSSVTHCGVVTPHGTNVCQVEQLICGTIHISAGELCCTLSLSKGNVLIINWRPLLFQCLCLSIAGRCTHRLVKLLCSIVMTVICDHCTETLTSLMVTIIDFTSQEKYLKCCFSMTNSRAHKSVQTTDIIEKFAWTVFLPLSYILDITPDFDLFCTVKDRLWGHC